MDGSLGIAGGFTPTSAGSSQLTNSVAAAANNKVRDIQDQAATQAAQSVTPSSSPPVAEAPSTRGLPENVGRNINITA